MISKNFENELRRISLITQHVGWSETALENEAKLDLQRLFRTMPRDIQLAIKGGRRGQVG